MLLRSVLAVLWTAFIFYALLSEASAVPSFWWLTLQGTDKLIHATLFGVEAVLIIWSLSGLQMNNGILWALVSCFLLGALTEVLQYWFVEGRSGEFTDLFADTIGAFFALVLWKKLKK